MEFKSRLLESAEFPDTKNVLARTVKLEAPKDFSFLPGQFVMIANETVKNRFNPSALKWASMSIASSPLDKGIIELGAELGEEGGVKHYICTRLSKGGCMLVKGPFGSFTLQDSNKERVFIALGTGITPLISMIRTLLRKQDRKPMTLFYSIKNSGLYLFRKELEEYEKKFSNFKLVITVTREDPVWKGRRGHVQEHFSSFDFGNKKNKTIYICGSPKAMEEIIKSLVSLSFREEQIRKEQW